MSLMPMSHLPTHAGTPASAHVSVPPEVGDFECGHLACDLPELGGEEDEGPGELEGGPEGDGDEEWVVCGEEAEG
jgi:hypothetical protein